MSSRRDFLKGIAAAPAVAIVPTQSEAKHSELQRVEVDGGSILFDFKYKRMTVEGRPCMIGVCRALRDMLDITSRADTYPFHRITGWDTNPITGEVSGWPMFEVDDEWQIDRPWGVKNGIFLGCVGFHIVGVQERERLYMNGNVIQTESDDTIVMSRDDYRLLLRSGLDQPHDKVHFLSAGPLRIMNYMCDIPREGTMLVVPV